VARATRRHHPSRSSRSASKSCTAPTRRSSSSSSEAAQEKGQYIERHRGRLAKVAAQAVQDAHERATNLVAQLEDARDVLAAAREQELWAHAYGNPDESTMAMPPFSSFGAQSKNVHTLVNASANVEYNRVIQALRAELDAISTVMTNAQAKVITPTEKTLPLSQLKTAVWEGSDEGQQAINAEKNQQRAADEKEWGKPSGGWQ
jgi:hypothetical protein